VLESPNAEGSSKSSSSKRISVDGIFCFVMRAFEREGLLSGAVSEVVNERVIKRNECVARNFGSNVFGVVLPRIVNAAKALR
jgi:hypothetical protein